MISAALSFFGARPALVKVLAVLIGAVALWLAGRAWVASIEHAAFERGKSACRQARLEQDLDAAGRALSETAASAAQAMSQTRVLGHAAGELRSWLNAQLQELELPTNTYQDARQESANAMANLSPDTDTCLDRVPDRRVCLARAKALGFDPELSCPAGGPGRGD
ncbi:hypothetical protein KUV46_15610 [Thalassovita mediterranea]|nr:hypothetical protein KUV46_15610 [Thalassovita mediterranea]